MLREKTWTDEELLHHGSELLKTCRLWQAMMVLNSDPRLAHTLGADGVHLTSARLMQTESRPDLPWCGASCHDEAELQRAARLGLDYVVLGPVRPTPSHPGRTGMGWKAFRELGTNYPLPIYALGGLTSGDLITAWGQGAQGVAMMRAAWTG
jgi:8-oxo-dGTP diphosphatase